MAFIYILDDSEILLGSVKYNKNLIYLDEEHPPENVLYLKKELESIQKKLNKKSKYYLQNHSKIQAVLDFIFDFDDNDNVYIQQD
jgi:hypothetical protein